MSVMMRLLSRLPLRLLYLKSDFLFLLVYYIIRYRWKTVTQNLTLSFPEKNKQEIAQIRKRFYRQFCDVIFETIRLYSMPAEELRSRCTFDKESGILFNGFFSKGQTIVGVTSHCGNWEWGFAAFSAHFKHLITGVYHPLSNKSADQFIKQERTRFGAEVIPMKKIFRHILELKEKHITTVIGLVADQSPPPGSAHWTTFLNQPAPVFNGPEKIARKFGYPVVFMRVTRVKRGNYALSVRLIAEDPSALKEGEITERHVRALEESIREQPSSWLWSHRRWKHKPEKSGLSQSGI
jgi:KDO2-lipid IV(A) lauroyltransferase